MRKSLFLYTFTLYAVSAFSFGAYAADQPAYMDDLRAALTALRTPATFPARISVNVGGPDRGMLIVEGGAMIPFDNTTPLNWRVAVDILGMYLNDGYAVSRLLGVPFLQPVYIIPVSSDQAGSAGAGLRIQTNPITGVQTRTQAIVLNMAKLDPSIDDVRNAFLHELTHTYSECGNKSICDEVMSQIVDRRIGYERPLSAAASLFIDTRSPAGVIDPARFNQEAVRFLTQNGNTSHGYAFGEILGNVLDARFGRPGDGGLRPVLDRIALARQMGDANRAAAALGFASSADFARAMLDGYRTMMRGVMADDRRAALFMGAMADATLHRHNLFALPNQPLALPLTHGYSSPSLGSYAPSLLPGVSPAYVRPPLITSPGPLFTPITVSPAIPVR